MSFFVGIFAFVLRLKNNTKSQSQIGYSVIIDPSDKSAFIYSLSTSTNVIGIIAESVPYRSDCNIITAGEGSVYISGSCTKGDAIRARKSTDKISNGQVLKVQSADTSYVQIGTALESGKGLVKCLIGIFYFGGGTGIQGIQGVQGTQGISIQGVQGPQGLSGSMGIPGEILLASEYNKDAVGGILLCSQYNP